MNWQLHHFEFSSVEKKTEKKKFNRNFETKWKIRRENKTLEATRNLAEIKRDFIARFKSIDNTAMGKIYVHIYKMVG